MARKTLSQNLWLRRNRSDAYYKEAKKNKLRARSAYKLIEINKKFKIFKNKKRIVDLGAAPGSWSQVAVSEISKIEKFYKIFSIDLKLIDPIPGVTCIKDDVTNLLEENNFFGKRSIDLVISDMAPNSSGHKFTDQMKAFNLSELALIFSTNYLVREGNFVCKLLGGNYDKGLYLKAKRHFKTVKYFKPNSSRKESKEIYLIGMSFNNLH